MLHGRALRRALIGAGLMIGIGALPAIAGEAEQKRAELKALQTRIRSLQKDIGATEESRGEVADQLQDTERGISQSRRRLHELAAERRAAEQELAALSEQSRTLEARIGAQQQRLEAMLYRLYLAGDGGALRHLLSGDRPEQRARDRYYLSRLSEAQAELIRGLRDALEEKKRLAEAMQQQQAKLGDIEGRERTEHAQLLDQKTRHRALLARLSDRIRTQRSEVRRLQGDEKRMTRLIEGLARIAKRPPRKAKSAPAPSSRLRNDKIPDDSLTGAFARLKGKLHLPVRGELAGRFGTPRHDGSGTWKGVFIRAAAGEVRAIAAGQVVFADWLRGFGNLTIVDHGDSYLSIYGNNESLLKEVGQTVRAGDAIAIVGSSGGSAESGLYFELRHEGQPLDPMKWVTLK